MGGRDVWLIKTDAAGNKLWDKTYGGVKDDEAHAVIQTADRGYIIVGYTASSGAGSKDVWLIKTDSSGNDQWKRTYGGTSDDIGYAVQQTTDNGFVITE